MRKLMNAILIAVSSLVACSAPPVLPCWWDREMVRMDRAERGLIELESARRTWSVQS